MARSAVRMSHWCLASLLRRRRRRNPQSEIRRDLELALQLGNKDALNAFLAQYPDGYYASLAKLQLAKIAAEETPRCGDREGPAGRTGAGAARHRGRTKDGPGEGCRRREGRRGSRIAAEKTKQAVQEQVAEAERQQVAADTLDSRQPPENKMAAVDASADESCRRPAGDREQRKGRALHR